jgi:hypothetical protein
MTFLITRNKSQNGVSLLSNIMPMNTQGHIYIFQDDSKHARHAHENEHIRKPHMMSYAWTQVNFERFVKWAWAQSIELEFGAWKEHYPYNTKKLNNFSTPMDECWMNDYGWKIWYIHIMYGLNFLMHR